MLMKITTFELVRLLLISRLASKMAFHAREGKCLILNLFSSFCFSSWNLFTLEQPHMISYPKISKRKKTLHI